MQPTPAPTLPWLLTAPVRRGWQGLLAALVIMVCWLAFSPAPPAAADTGWDKANHALAFAALGFTAEFAFWPLRARRWINGAGLLCLGVMIELVQTQIPGRSGEWPDLLADAVGLAMGLLAAAPTLSRLGTRPG